MLCPAVDVELIIAIETFTTEAAKRVSPKTTLIDCTRVVVTFLHMPLQLPIRK
jgi:hypothetical protein